MTARTRLAFTDNGPPHPWTIRSLFVLLGRRRVDRSRLAYDTEWRREMRSLPLFGEVARARQKEVSSN